MATKKEAPKKEAATKKAKKELTAEEKAAKRKARMEAIKNRPEEQRPNGKQVDVMKFEKGEVQTFGYPIKTRAGHLGVLVTSVVVNEKGEPVSSSIGFVPGDLTVKAKKKHGTIIAARHKKDKDAEGDEAEAED